MSDEVPAPSGAPERGRPRDAAIDRRVLASAEAILQADGLAGLTMERVARAARIGKQTLYRRYPTRLPLLVDLMRHLSEARAPSGRIGVPDATPASVRRAIEAAYRFASSPAGEAVMRALLAEAAGDRDALALIRDRFVDLRRGLLVGAIMHEADVGRAEAEMRTDMAYGLMWYRLGMGLGPSADAVEAVVAMTLRRI